MHERQFKIRGATFDDEHRVVWLCRYYEPFNVVSVGDTKSRQKMWKEAYKYFGKMLLCRYDKESVRGTPLGLVEGVEII